MLIECPECGRNAVSDSARQCPRCGIASPGELFWRNRRRPCEEATQQILNARKAWVKFVARPCTCQQYEGQGYDVVGRIVEAKGVWSSERALYQHEYSGGSYYYAWNGREPEYYIEFAVKCEVCQRTYVGTLSYGNWSYNSYYPYRRLYIRADGPVRPAPNAPYLAFSIKLLVGVRRWLGWLDWEDSWVWCDLSPGYPR